MYKVLIADDEPHIINGLKRMIDWKECGFEICGCAETGDEALELFDKLKPELVMLDIMMPVYNGVELAGMLRDRGYQGEIILLTGYSDIEYAREAMKYHVKYYFNKPIDAKEITEVLQTIRGELDRKEEERKRQSGENGFNKLSEYAEAVVQCMKNNDAEAIGRLIAEAVNSVISSSDAAGRLKVFCAYIEMMVLNMLTQKNIDAYEELDSVYADLYGSPEEIIASLTELCTETIKLMKDHTTESDSIFSRTEKYLREHYTEEIMIKDMAKNMYISPVYLGSLFSKNAGVSMSTYIHSLRMEKIVSEIFASDRPMKDIIYDVGYNNYNNFFRWFSKFFGCSPEEFKKAMYLL